MINDWENALHIHAVRVHRGTRLNETLDTEGWTVFQTRDKFYRFVDHEGQLLTAGFRTREALLRNRNGFRNDSGARDIMRKRYDAEFAEV